MAEITTNKSEGEGRKRTIKAKKISTKIDMTPMVDLAFLLLTFFMLANTLLRPYAMDIAMPEKKSGDSTSINYKDVLSLTLAENNKIYYSDGTGLNSKQTNYSDGGIRKVLIESKRSNPKLYVLIKPTEKANYKNVVDIFDEMVLLNIPRYALVDPTANDLNEIKDLNK